MDEAPTHVRWSQIREISDITTRMYWHRSVMSMSSSFSTAEQYPKLLISGET